MADNYLEKQYEAYAARKAAWERARRLGKRVPGMTKARKPVAPAAASSPVGGQAVENSGTCTAEEPKSLLSGVAE